MEPIRTYFIGAGPSIAMGIPSVDELYGKVLEERQVLDGMGIESFVRTFFPNLEGNKLNFEELMTILDTEGIGPEIFKVARDPVREYEWDPASMQEISRDLMSRAFMVIKNQMGDLNAWAKYAEMKAPGNEEVKKEILSKRQPIEPIRDAWAKQYRKINDRKIRECVLTTNYDLWIEKWSTKGYTYVNFDSNKTMIIKLHGSINWEMRTAGQFFEKDYFQNCEILSYGKESRIMALPLQHVLGMIAFGPDPVLPIIVPPMALKRYEEPLFRQMFWNASNILMNSEELVILGYRCSDFDFYVKKLIDFAINANESKITKIYHYDLDDAVRVKFQAMMRKSTLKYIFVHADFRNVVPDFDNLGTVCSI